MFADVPFFETCITVHVLGSDILPVGGDHAAY